MIGEMVALLANEIYVFEKQLSPEEIAKFESARQTDRIRILRQRGAIADEHTTAFNRIKDIRNRYLHIFTQSHDRIMHDAGNAFHAAQALVALTLFDGFLEGRVRVTPSFARYLERMGVATRTGPMPPGTDNAANEG
jgi:AcrR family transcriptional regulator